ncbi:hypothetical protein NE237_008880 [Protea cynaroides]|uniref:Uncharacterized protein n=1 Tax=Protea cynaroides TaxID=273540 RepID=A0A9Q0QZR4_9MAGN|nr:hypothetical protein NE237_008880 [Protea cynaroides]
MRFLAPTVLDIRGKNVKYTYNYQNLTNFDGNLPSYKNFSAKLPSTKLKAATIVILLCTFEDSVLVASCAFLLELCGLSSSMPRVDIAALRCISSFHKSNDYNEHSKHLSPKGFAFHVVSHESDIIVSLAQALADDYLHNDIASTIKQKDTKSKTGCKKLLRVVMAIVQHLEKESLPSIVDGKVNYNVLMILIIDVLWSGSLVIWTNLV